jgi:hypothetical protein
MLPFFFRHYDDWIDRYVVYDDGSSDDTLDLLHRHPKVEVRTPPPRTDPSSRVESQRALQETFWHESRGAADWVIVTDVDEHLHHRTGMKSYLSRCRQRGITIVPAIGYQMMSRAFPADGVLHQLITTGLRDDHYNKLSILDPDAVEATNFTVGRHLASPTGSIVAPERDEVRLLHFHYTGFERVRRRHELYLTRSRARDLELRWGVQYSWSDEELASKWLAWEQEVRDITAEEAPVFSSAAGSLDVTADTAPRWWEKFRVEHSGD